MTVPPKGRRVAIIGVMVLTALIAACATRTVIPDGAQRVHLESTPDVVHLEPSTVQAGDIYFVIDGSGALVVEKSDAPGARRGFTDDELAAFIRTGDVFHTAIQDVTAGYAGNVFKLTLGPGRYAFLPIGEGEAVPETDAETRNALCHADPVACAALPPLPVTVLEVLP
jgi:hypothetical protein